MIPRLAWHALVARRHPGWRGRLAEIRSLASGTGVERLERGRRVVALAAHLRWAAATIPWFRGRGLDDAGLADFPILSRADLQAHREALKDPARPASDLRMDASGGSTGEPVRLYHDAAYRTWTFATEVWVGESWGLRPWDRVAYLWGDDREPKDVGRGEAWKRRARLRLLDIEFLNAFRTTDADMERFAERLERRPPACLFGYATALDLFASFVRRSGRDVRPRVVRSAAEALSPDARRRMQATFLCPVRDFYGSRESAALAAECAAGSMHVLAHGKVIEIVDGAGRPPPPPGEPGRVLVTDLTNRAFGLVRYENGDVASWSTDDAPCACGRAYPRLERIWGRTSDFVTTPSGERVHGEWFTHLFYEAGAAGGAEGAVARFQVRQTALDAVEVLTVGPAGEAEMAPRLEKMRARLGAGVRVSWRRVDDIPLSPSGKHRFTVSDVPFLPPERGAGAAT